MIAHTCYECWMIDKTTGPTKLIQICNNNTVSVKDLGSACLRSIQELCEGWTAAWNSKSTQDWFANFPNLTKTSLGCGNLVPTPSHTTSGETSICTSRILHYFWPKLGLKPQKPTMGRSTTQHAPNTIIVIHPESLGWCGDLCLDSIQQLLHFTDVYHTFLHCSLY